MQRTGQRLGMKDSTFADPAGLDDKTSYKGGPRMSAYDIAIATRNALAVPEIAKYAGLRTFKFDDPTGAAPLAHEPQQDPARLEPRATRGHRLQDRLHGARRPHDRRPPRPATAAR